MNRRELLQHVARLMGGVISAPAMLGVLNGCSANANAAATRAVFTDAQNAIVAEVAEIIIPRTDTPGAKDVGVPAFIETMLRDAYAPEDQRRFIVGLDEFDAQSVRDHGKAFLELDSAQRLMQVQSIHDAAIAAELQHPLPPAQLRRPFILMTKELSLLGFFTSQIGATQVLQYDPVPGAYRACIPVSQAGNGKTWAIETSGPF